MKEQHRIIPLLFDKVRAGMAPGKAPPAIQQVYGLVLCMLNPAVLITVQTENSDILPFLCCRRKHVLLQV